MSLRFAALFLGRLPDGLAGFLSGYLRWVARVQGDLTGQPPGWPGS